MLKGLVGFVRVFVGVALVAIGIWGLKDARSINADYAAGLEFLNQQLGKGVPQVAQNDPSADFEGQLVYLQGQLEAEPATDPLTGLSLSSTGLTRYVEMLQWQEESRFPSSSSASTNKTEMVYSWHKVWSEEIINSDLFNEQLLSNEHDNPKALPHENRVWFLSPALSIGAWELTDGYTQAADLEAVPRELLSSSPLADGWQAAGDFVQPAGQAIDSIGAVRLRYEYMPITTGTYSVIGLVRGGKLDDNIHADLHYLPLIKAGDVSREDMIAGLQSFLAEGWNPGNTWAFYVFAGLMLSLGVLARLIKGLRGLTEAPIGKRLAITALAAGLCTAIVGTLV